MHRMPIGRILVPTDLSEPIHHALACARLFAEKHAAHVDVVCAVPVRAARALLDHPEATLRMRNLEARLREEAAVRLGPEVSFEVKVIEGAVLPLIVKLAEELQSDLIVIGPRGLRGWRRTFLGSLTSAILQASSRPLRAVKLIDDGRGFLLFWRQNPADRIRRRTVRKEDLLRWHQSS